MRAVFQRRFHPRWALLVVALAQLLLSVDYYVQRWHVHVMPQNRPPDELGEGWIICHNGLGYYAWLRSLLIDGDVDFANEFDGHGLPGDYVPPSSYRTPIGRRANQWSIGPSLIWSISVAPTHLLLRICEDRGS